MSQKGDRNFWQLSRLKGNCPKCGLNIPTVQNVNKHRDRYALLTHRCQNCGKLLHIQRYSIAQMQGAE